MVECLAACLVWSWFVVSTPGDAEETVRRLGADTFREREITDSIMRRELPIYAPLLRRALGDPDPEIRRRANLLLEGTRRGREVPGWQW